MAVRYSFVIGPDDYTNWLEFYVEEKTGTKAILSTEGEPAPYNGEPPYSINTKKAENLGYTFTELKDWFYELLDEYIQG